ncbi:MAG TPA: hypothetical protein VF257_11540 [Solirubrobacteraceae bacterium]
MPTKASLGLVLLLAALVAPGGAASAGERSPRITVNGEPIGTTQHLRGTVVLPIPVSWTNQGRSAEPRIARFSVSAPAWCSSQVIVTTRGVATKAGPLAQVDDLLRVGTILRKGRRHRGAWEQAAMPSSAADPAAQHLATISSVRLSRHRYVQIRADVTALGGCDVAVFRNGPGAVGSERIVKDANVQAHVVRNR